MGDSRNPHPKTYIVHMIGNAHVDHAWLWRWPEARDEVLATCRSALDLMKESPGFIFCFSSAISYRWIEEGDPTMFEEIRQRVAEGRWHIVGGWWVEPDCNIPCGESFVRQVLYGKRYFRQTFDVDVAVGYNVDSFGHAGTLPQILAKAGQPYYVFFRPDPDHEVQLESSVFWWESADGSRVLACRPPLHYNTGPEDIEGRIWAAYLKTHPLLCDVMCFYGVGNHGGGPTLANLAAIKRLAAWEHAPRVIFSTPDCFFQAAEARSAEIPVRRHDLQYHARGCYTAESEVKRHNRRAENLLLTAERLCTLSTALFGQAYPRQALTSAWHHVLFNQFHDILAGSSIPEVYNDARAMYGETYRLAGRALDQALKAIAAHIDTRGPGQPLILFNPLAWPRRSPVEVALFWEGPAESLRLTDDRGHQVALQVLESTGRDSSACLRAVFIADLPALGYRVYHLSFAGQLEAMAAAGQRPLAASPTALENAWWRLELDPQMGHLTRLYDKQRHVEVLVGPGNVPVVLHDPSDTWSHGVDAFRDEVGRFRSTKVELVESGPVRAVLRVHSSFGRSTVQQDTILYRDLEAIDFRMLIDWHEHNRMLKLSFPCNIASPTATYEVPYGHIVRPPNGNEEPGQQWIDVTGVAWDASGAPQPYGVGLINDCKYGFDVLGPAMYRFDEPVVDIRLSVLRSPMYAYHEAPLPWGPGITNVWIDQGEQTLAYGLVPHPGRWQDSGLVRRAYELNNPPIVLREPVHPGDLAPAHAFAEVEPANVVLTTLKCAEDCDDLILRCYEAAGRDVAATVSLPDLGCSWEGPVCHCEIKTLRLAGGQIAESDLLELDKI